MAGELHVPTKLSGEGGTSHTDWPAGTKETGPLGVLVAGGGVEVGVRVSVTPGTTVGRGVNVGTDGVYVLATTVKGGISAKVITAGGGKVAVGAGVAAGAQAVKMPTKSKRLQIHFRMMPAPSTSRPAFASRTFGSGWPFRSGCYQFSNSLFTACPLLCPNCCRPGNRHRAAQCQRPPAGQSQRW